VRPIRAAETRRAVAIALVACSAAVWLGAEWLDRRDAARHLTVHCVDGDCTATLDGGPELELRLPAGSRHNRVGLYVFHPYEEQASQAFRNLTVTSADSRHSPIDLPLTRETDLASFDVDRGWTVDRRRGMTHRGEKGERAVALLRRPYPRRFTLEVDLVASVDAGVILGASDPGNGTLLVVRSRYNDALTCRLTNGRPGAVDALTPLGELQASRELWRLGGLIAEILLVAVLLLLLARGFVAIAPEMPTLLGPVRSLLGRVRPSPAWLGLLAVATIAALTAIAVFGLDRMPHIEDEAAYLFQARVFAEGQLWAPAPAPGDFFLYEHVILDGQRWFSKYPPLFSLLLSLGVHVGAPWIVNPLLGALTGFVAFLLARELGGFRTGLLTWLLLLVSPFFLIMGATMMSHMTAALLVTLGLWLTVRGLRLGSSAYAGLAGASFGLALFARPYTAFLSGAVVGVAFLLAWLKAEDRERVLRLALCFVVLAAPMALGFFGWNALYSEGGGVGLYGANNSTDRLGFGPDKGADWLLTWGSFGHTPAKALRSAHQYLEYTSNHLLGWPWRLSLAFVVAALWTGWARLERWMLAGVLIALAGGHMLYWATQHLLYGARYWFAAVPALMVLSALGIRAVARHGRRSLAIETEALDARQANVDGPSCPSAAAIAVLVVALVAGNFLLYFPGRYRELATFGGITADLRRAVDAADLQDAVVFVTTQGLKFNDGFFMNDPFLRGDRVFARDLGPRNAELLERFPDFRGYRWNGQYLEPLERQTVLEARHTP
jgi:hypothetical protein